MTKFYVHRTNLAYVREIVEIEAKDADQAVEFVQEGDGDFVGLYIGDYCSTSIEEIEVTEAAKHYLPKPFYHAGCAA